MSLSNLTKLLLYSENGLDAIIEKIRNLTQTENKNGRNTIQYFRDLDRDRDGRLSCDEIRSGLAFMSQNSLVLENEELALLVKKILSLDDKI